MMTYDEWSSKSVRERVAILDPEGQECFLEKFKNYLDTFQPPSLTSIWVDAFLEEEAEKAGHLSGEEENAQ